jgi:hypothetical protein
MRKALVVSLLLATAACGQQSSSERSSQDLKSYDVQSEPAPPAAEQTSVSDASTQRMAPPAIAPTAAPGVAFNYRYAFRLAGERIGAVQEQHAQACEKLGITRCRITGMRYRLAGNDDIEAMLAFKLDPTLARAFGKEGIAAVTRAEGMLVDAEISGEDVGSKISAARRTEAELDEELKRAEAELARPGLRGAERAELQIRVDQLRDQIRATRTARGEQQESLATTPMVFNYGSGKLVPGFDNRPRLRQALDDALDNFLGGLAWIFVALITLLPWALVLGLLAWAGRRLARRFIPPAPPTEA